MTLTLMLDENISPVVDAQIRAKHPEIDVQSIYYWRKGAFVGAADPVILAALHEETHVLVTYDTQMLSEWSDVFSGSVPFGGIIFVDEHTIASNDIGGLVLALIVLWDQNQYDDWTNRIDFLQAWNNI